MISNPGNDFVRGWIKPKDGIGTVDCGSRKCSPFRIDAFMDGCTVVGNRFGRAADGNGIAIRASCLLEDNRTDGGDRGIRWAP